MADLDQAVEDGLLTPDEAWYLADDDNYDAWLWSWAQEEQDE